MTDSDRMRELIERSSFGTPGAKALRARTPKSVVDQVLARISAPAAAYAVHATLRLTGCGDPTIDELRAQLTGLGFDTIDIEVGL